MYTYIYNEFLNTDDTHTHILTYMHTYLIWIDMNEHRPGCLPKSEIRLQVIQYVKSESSWIIRLEWGLSGNIKPWVHTRLRTTCMIWFSMLLYPACVGSQPLVTQRGASWQPKCGFGGFGTVLWALAVDRGRLHCFNHGLPASKQLEDCHWLLARDFS